MALAIIAIWIFRTGSETTSYDVAGRVILSLVAIAIYAAIILPRRNQAS